MRTLLRILSAVALCALIMALGAAVRLGWQAAETLRAWQAIPARLTQVIDQRLQSVEKTTDSRLASIQQTADRRLASLQADADARLDTTIRLADAQLAAMRGELLAEVHPLSLEAAATLRAYGALPMAIQPTVQTMNELSGPFLRNALGAVAAVKVTAGDLAKAGRTFESTSLSMNAAAQNSAEASKQTAIVMSNFAKATKPLPTWVRIGLAVAPPIAQTAFAVVGSIK
jgi:hypothetical protein